MNTREGQTGLPSFGLIFLLFLAVAFLCRVDFVFYILYVCIGIYAWSKLVTPRLLRGVLVQREYPDHAFLNEPVEVQISFRNEKRWPIPWLEVNESIPPNLYGGQPMQEAFSLRGRDDHTLRYAVRSNRRGYYRLGPLTVQAGDLFGFAQRNWLFPPDYLTVYPRIVPLERLRLPSRLPFGTIASKQRLFEDPARPQGIRAYRSGDSQRQIHWKASAHVGQLVVKTYEPAISLETAILLNLDNDAYERKRRAVTVEWAVEVAASLAVHLVGQRQAIGLMTNGLDPLRPRTTTNSPQFDDQSGRLLFDVNQSKTCHPIPPRPGREHLMKVLEMLARVESGQTVPFVEWLPAATVGLSWGVTLLTITPRGDLATCNALHRLVRAGFNPVLLAIEADMQFGQVRERARQLGFAAYHVREVDDLRLR